MLRLAKSSLYAISATAYIAGNGKTGPITGRAIASACGISGDYLLKILQQLVRGNVLVSEIGRHGGYRLRKPADTVTLLEIVEAVEGPIGGAAASLKQVPLSNGVSEGLTRALEQLSALSIDVLKTIKVQSLLPGRRLRDRDRLRTD